ncbi:DUF3080 family protein [Halopseudomonas nanhaiensis]|uniref:DUF3080 family protein n=1 Tax=Halopseudomonas nanhaiensis TaxID=2830842 RepID=UPI001CBD4F98|nr:DUF3080 family protein [Halopseudomonas nanhaiensis]UAW97173.1 DUF3080 family protein [Halopseudomonas nanhaiensis]
MRNAVLLAVLVTLSGLLAGCSREPEASRQMDNYLERVGRVLDQEWEPWRVERLTAYRPPSRRQAVQPIPELRLSILDLLVDSRDCGPFQQLIAERNSSLGRLMAPSTLLGFEGELLRALDSCLDVIADQPGREGLTSELQRIADVKRDNLTRRFWNSLAGSEEFSHFLRFADQPLPVSDTALPHPPGIDALRQLAAIGSDLPDRLPPDRPQTEPLFATLARDQRSGELIHSLARLTHTLDQATAMLRARPAGYVCPMGTATDRSRTLLNVFGLFYAGEVQPQMAQAQRLGEPWQAALNELSNVDGASPAVARYIDELVGEQDGLWERYQRSIASHSKAWQDVLGACQMQPGQPGWQERR